MRDPIFQGVHPDPSIVRVDDDYFVVNSTFEYTPGVSIHHSKDLVSWDLIGHALTRPSQLDIPSEDPGGGVWAPTIRYWKGKFYICVCVVLARSKKPLQPQGFYVWTDNIWNEQAWSDPIYFDLLGIDQDLFFDEDDRVYLSVARFCPNPDNISGRSIYTFGCEIDLASGNTIGKVILLKRQEPGINTVAEGPHIFKKDGMYYLFTAEGGTGDGHSVIVSRSKSPLGPYEEAPDGVNPLVHHPASDTVIRRTGHADLVMDKQGRWWAVLLGVRPQQGGLFQLGRETFLVPVDWPKDEWPVFNKGRPLEVDSSLSPPISQNRWWTDEFQGHLSPRWYRLRSPRKPFHHFVEGCPGVTLRGNGHVLKSQNAPATLLCKQPSYSCRFSTELTFEGAAEGEEAGLSVYYSHISYAALSVAQIGRQQKLVLSWTDPSTRHLTRTVKEVEIETPLLLEVKARPLEYTFRYRGRDGSMIDLKTLPSTFLDGGSDQEQAFYFVGTHFGIFAQGNEGEHCEARAVFR